MTNNNNKTSPKNTYILDQESAAEMTRLIEQDRFVTAGLGGLFPGYPEAQLKHIHQLLDIGCGPGEWAREVARRYPHIQVIGVDISERMIEFAKTQAEAHHIPNVTFLLADALQLGNSFPDHSFDFINGRFLFTFLQEEGWRTLLHSCWHLLRPGGVTLLTEVDHNTIAGADTLIEFFEKVNQVMYRRKMSFAGRGGCMAITPKLPPLLRDAGFSEVTLTPSILDISLPQFRPPYIADVKVSALGMWERFRSEHIFSSRKQYDEFLLRMEKEMSQDSFNVLWYLLTIQARVPQ